jgi:hypothetical protein
LTRQSVERNIEFVRGNPSFRERNRFRKRLTCSSINFINICFRRSNFAEKFFKFLKVKMEATSGAIFTDFNPFSLFENVNGEQISPNVCFASGFRFTFRLFNKFSNSVATFDVSSHKQLVLNVYIHLRRVIQTFPFRQTLFPYLNAFNLSTS